MNFLCATSCSLHVPQVDARDFNAGHDADNTIPIAFVNDGQFQQIVLKEKFHRSINRIL